MENNCKTFFINLPEYFMIRNLFRFDKLFSIFVEKLKKMFESSKYSFKMSLKMISLLNYSTYKLYFINNFKTLY